MSYHNRVRLRYPCGIAGSTSERALDVCRTACPTAGEVLTDTGRRVVELGPQGGELHVRLPEAGGARLRVPAPGERPRRLGLVLADVQLVHPGAYFAVYLNLPKDAEPDFSAT